MESLTALATTRTEIATSVLKKANDHQKQQGQAAVSLLQDAANLQQQITPPASPPGMGQNVNLYA